MIDITEVNTKNFQTWPKARRITYHTLVVGCQFLVAVDELMSTTRSYIKLNDEEQVVTWTLPASQLGTRGPTFDISLKCTCIMAGKTQHGGDLGPRHGQLRARSGHRPDPVSTGSADLNRSTKPDLPSAAGF